MSLFSRTSPVPLPLPAQPSAERDPHAGTNLTRRQLYIWIGQRVRPDVPDANMASLVFVDGRLDPAAFEAAVQRTLDGSDSMRTVIDEIDGVPMQRVIPSMKAGVERVDLSGERDAEQSARDWAVHRCQRVFDLSDRTFAFALLHLGPDRWAWFVTRHHVVEDFFSLTIILDKLSRAYADVVADRASAPLAQFSEYLAAERAYTESQQHVADEAWWTRALEGASTPLSFYGRPALQAARSDAERWSVALGARRTEHVRLLATRLGPPGLSLHANLQNLLCTVLCAWLHRIGPNEAVTIGLPFHNRAEAFRDTIGLFMEMLPLRTEVEESETFMGLFERITNAARDALEHRRYAVANPLHDRKWDVVLNYLLTDFHDFGGLPMRYERVFSGHLGVALQVQVHDANGSGMLHVDFEMALDRFAAEVRPRVAGHFLRLLDALLDDPRTPIACVDLVGEDERQRLASFSRTAIPLPEESTFPALLERAVRAYAERDALWCEGEVTSYRDLNARANRMAHYLRSLGVGPDRIVGVHLERRAELMVTLLGILKAGGAWVFLDPSYPLDRLSFMLEDTRAAAVVTQSSLRERLGTPSTRVVLVDEDGPRIATHPADDPSPVLAPDHLAYVIYTSGSTGRPKGVQNTHRNLVNFLAAMCATPWVLEGDTLMALSALSFDMCIPELFLPLVVGARLALVSREVAADGRDLVDRMARADANAMIATPSTWRMLLDAGWAGRADMKAHCAGETFPVDLAEQLLGRVALLWNGYGPTECTVYTTTHELMEVDGPVPIGKPVGNYETLICDARGNLLPIGVPGELLIGGLGVSRGYLNQPELTAERFVPHPLRADGGRVYRSGDLVRCREDGTIEYMGRIDHQVKVRGFRIELGEIEARLSEHPEVNQAVVMAREDTPGDRVLAAYIVAADPVPTQTTLRRFLRERLPDFMVPATFVFLPAFPLGSTGKVDRRALPVPPRAAEQPLEGEGARDLVEFQLVKIFEEVLGVQPVGIFDNFFDLGGNSLRAVRVLARIEMLLGRQLPLTSLFASPTVDQLAAVLRDGGWQPALDSMVPLQPRGHLPPFFCVHALIGDVCRDLGRNAAPDQPFYGLQPRGLDGRQEPLGTIEEMAAYYVERVREVQATGPYYLGGYCFGGMVAFEMARQLTDAGEEIALLAVIDTPVASVRPRSLGGRLRAVVNAPLIAAEKAFKLLRQRPGELVSAVRRRLRISAARRRASESGPVLADRDLSEMIERLHGISRWPQNYQRIARINFHAIFRYVARPYPGRVTLIRGMPPMHRWSFEDPCWGWRELAGEVDLHVVDGAHEEIMNEPHVRGVAAVLQACLHRARLA